MVNAVEYIEDFCSYIEIYDEFWETISKFMNHDLFEINKKNGAVKRKLKLGLVYKLNTKINIAFWIMAGNITLINCLNSLGTKKQNYQQLKRFKGITRTHTPWCRAMNFAMQKYKKGNLMFNQKIFLKRKLS